MLELIDKDGAFADESREDASTVICCLRRLCRTWKMILWNGTPRASACLTGLWSIHLRPSMSFITPSRLIESSRLAITGKEAANCRDHANKFSTVR